MGVQLNIKDPETVRLARELAGQTGRTVTETIRVALEQAQATRKAENLDKVGRIKNLLKGSRDLWKDEWKDKSSKEIMDSLYDQDGLPI